MIKIYCAVNSVINSEESDFNDTFTFLAMPENSPHLSAQPLVTASESALTRLQVIASREDVELCFVSSWNDQGNIVSLLEQLDWQAPYTALPAKLDNTATGMEAWTLWKADAIIEDQAESSTPFIWIDAYAPKFHYEHVVQNTLGHVLILSPNKFLGLNDADLTRVEGFILNTELYS